MSLGNYVARIINLINIIKIDIVRKKEFNFFFMSSGFFIISSSATLSIWWWWHGDSWLKQRVLLPLKSFHRKNWILENNWVSSLFFKSPFTKVTLFAERLSKFDCNFDLIHQSQVWWNKQIKSFKMKAMKSSWRWLWPLLKHVLLMYFNPTPFFS